MHAFPKSTSPRLRNPGRPFLVMPAGNEFIRFSHTSDPRRLRHATGRWHIRVNQAISKRLGGSGSKLGLLIVIEIACVFFDDVNQDLAILYCSSVTGHRSPFTYVLPSFHALTMNRRIHVRDCHPLSRAKQRNCLGNSLGETNQQPP